MITCTKSYRDLPAAHRQPGHDGHCRLIHGHNWSFDLTFACDRTDVNGFVVDVGKLKAVKSFLDDAFDHTLLLNLTDPLWEDAEDDDAFICSLGVFARIVKVPNCGMEGLAKWVADGVNSLLASDRDPFLTEAARTRGLRVVRVVCWEDSKNWATYEVGR